MEVLEAKNFALKERVKSEPKGVANYLKWFINSEYTTKGNQKYIPYIHSDICKTIGESGIIADELENSDIVTTIDIGFITRQVTMPFKKCSPYWQLISMHLISNNQDVRKHLPYFIDPCENGGDPHMQVSYTDCLRELEKDKQDDFVRNCIANADIKGTTQMLSNLIGSTEIIRYYEEFCNKNEYSQSCIPALAQAIEECEKLNPTYIVTNPANSLENLLNKCKGV